MIKKQIFYITEDGEQFETKEAAQRHQRTAAVAERLEEFLDDTFDEAIIDNHREFIEELLDCAADLAEALKEPRKPRKIAAETV